MSGSSEIERLPEPADEVTRATADLERAKTEANEVLDQLAGLEGTGTGTELARTGPGVDPERAKSEMTRLRNLALRKQDEVERTQERLKSELNRRMAEAEAVLGPLQKKVDRLNEGLWSFGLYLGRDEEIFTLVGEEGEPAPDDEPIVVRQLVLSMDEECAVAAEEGGIDAVDQERFDEWLLEDPAHVEQVAPEAKCVVALVPRFGDPKEHRDAYTTMKAADANLQTYFLIRNGERLYYTWTDFRAGRRLIPGRDEILSTFEEKVTDRETRETVRRPIRPGTLAWERAEERADARQRHYMRVFLILQGLLDRTTVFHPLPDGAGEVSFLDERHHREGRVRFVLDADPALTAAGHEPFRDWQRRLCAELRPGMRLLGAFRGQEWRGANDYYDWKEHPRGHSRLRPDTAEPPVTGKVHEIEERRPDGGLVIRYEREEEVWDPDAWRENPERPGWGWRGEWRKPKVRASCTVYPTDRFVLPFDGPAIGEMERYLRSRTERHEYLGMFPLLKAAIRARRAEEAEEAPFRAMLAGVLARDNGVGVGEAADAVPDLVRWWKLASRRHRPLVGEEEENREAVRGISAEHARRLGEQRRLARRPDAPKILARLRKDHPEALLVARKRDGAWVVLEPERRPDPRSSGDAANVFVREFEYGALGALRAGFPKRWRTVGARPDKHSWRVLHESPRWAGWDRHASLSEHLADPERLALAEEVAALHESGADDPPLAAVTYFPRVRSFVAWTLVGGASGDRQRPLTVRPERPGLGDQAYRWRRSRGRRAVLDMRTRGRYPHWSDEADDPPGIMLVRREDVLRRIVAERENHEAARAEHTRLANLARTYERGVEDAWMKRAEDKAYSRFIEDYADPDRWEGHRKTLSIRYPHRSVRLDRLVARLVELGVELNGVRVADAPALARARGVEVRLELPEDLAELRFPVLAPPNDGSED